MRINKKLKSRVLSFYDDFKEENIRKDTANSFIYSLSFKVIINVLEILSIMVLARIILVSDFGLFAIAVSSTILVSSFATLGLSKAAIQSKKLSYRQSSNLFWVNSSIGFILFILLAFLSPIIALIYDNQFLITVIIVLSIKIFINSLATQHLVLLSRLLNFKLLGLIQIAAKFVSLLIGIAYALIYKSIWALILTSLLESILLTVILWGLVKWIPVFPKRLSSIKSHIVFGGKLSLSSVLMILSKNIDKLLLGYYVNPASVAIYQKSFSLTRKQVTEISDSIRGVSLVTFSKLQDKPAEYREFFSNFIFITSLLTMPLLVLMIIYADEVVKIILGPNWIECVPILQILAIGSIFEATSRIRASVLTSLGLINKIIKLQLFRGLIEIIAIVIGIIFGGVKGIAIALSLVTFFYSIFSIQYAIKNTPISVLDYYKALLAPLISAVITAFILYFIKIILFEVKYEYFLILNFGLLFLIYFALVLIFPKSRKVISVYMKFLTSKIKTK